MELRKQSIFMDKKPKRTPEKNSGDVKVDQVHIPISDLVRDFVASGQIYAQNRAQMYHDRYGKDSMESFKPINPGADPTEFEEYANEVSDHATALIEEELKNRDRKSKETPAKGPSPDENGGLSGEGNESGNGQENIPDRAGKGGDS